MSALNIVKYLSFPQSILIHGLGFMGCHSSSGLFPSQLRLTEEFCQCGDIPVDSKTKLINHISFFGYYQTHPVQAAKRQEETKLYWPKMGWRLLKLVLIPLLNWGQVLPISKAVHGQSENPSYLWLGSIRTIHERIQPSYSNYTKQFWHADSE